MPTATSSVAATIAEGQRRFAVLPLAGAGRANGLAGGGRAGPRPGRGPGAGLGPYPGGATGLGGATGPRTYCTGGSTSAKSAGAGRIACSGWVSARMGAGAPPPLRAAAPGARSALVTGTTVDGLTGPSPARTAPGV